nr:hypothetical protein [Kofleriaceae bacterium]
MSLHDEYALADVMRLANCQDDTIRDARARGELAFVVRGGRYYYPHESTRTWIASRPTDEPVRARAPRTRAKVNVVALPDPSAWPERCVHSSTGTLPWRCSACWQIAGAAVPVQRVAGEHRTSSHRSAS